MRASAVIAGTVARRMVWPILAAGVLGAACSRYADLPRNTQTVGGVTIDLGVVPAALITGHSLAIGDPKALHGGTPPNLPTHHIVVALFDASTGARITDARVQAGVGDHSYNHDPTTKLEPMDINGARTYGNFFSIYESGEWRIHLKIWRAGTSRPIEATFAYEHPPDS